jgi:hypothetical protein
MNTKLFKLLTAGIFALLSACGDNSMESGDRDPVQTTATLNVLVKDAITNASLKASVKLSTGASDSTDASGFVYFKGIPVGNHRALIEKTGYASVVLTPSIASTTVQSIFIARDTTVNAALYPQTSGLEGYVLFEDKKGVSKPPTKATVRFIANTNLNLVDNVFEVDVSPTNGKFSFKNLPAIGTQYSLQVLEVAADGKQYAAKPGAITAVELVSGTTVYFKSSIKYTANDLVDLFELTSFNNTIKSTDTLKLEFSDDIDAAKFKPDMISFGPTTTTVTTVVEKIVKGKTLNLVPADKWPSSFTFTVGSSNPIVSVNGVGCTSSTKTVYVDGIFELVNYKNTVKGKDTLILEFSDSIDAAKFRDGMVTLSNNIVAEKIVDGKKLKLIPADNWPNSFTFTIGGGSANATNNIISVNGMTYYTSAKTIYMEGIFELVSYKTTLKSRDTLVLEFSDTIDAVKFKPSMIYFTGYTGTLPVIDMRVEDKQIKLIPSGNWPAPSFEFYFNSSNAIVSVKGVSYPTSTTTNKKVFLEGTFDIVNYSDIVKPTDTVFVEFSDSIDVARFRPAQVYCYVGNVDCNKIVDGKKLKLLPIGNGGIWPADGFRFTISYNGNNLVSVKGIPATNIQKEVTVDGYFSYVSYSPNPLASTDTLVLEFNNSIDTNGIYSNITSNTTNFSGDFNIKWEAANGKKLKLTPKSKSRWAATGLTSTFNVSFNANNLKSLSGLAYNGVPGATINIKAYPFNPVKQLINNSVFPDSLDPATTDITNPIIIEFSDTINAAQLVKSGTVNVGANNNCSTPLAIGKSIVDGKKLRLDLLAGNKWPIPTSSPYTFYVCFNGLTSVNNVSYNGYNGYLQIALKQRNDLNSVKVTGLKIVKSDFQTQDSLDYYGGDTYLTWKRVQFVGHNFPGGYRIYKKEGTGNFERVEDFTNTNQFIEVPNTSGGIDTMYYRRVSVGSNALTDNKSAEFIVVAYNDIAMGNVNEATRLAVKDTRNPTINSYPLYAPAQVASKDTLSRWIGYAPVIDNYTYNSNGDYRSCFYDSDYDGYDDTYYSCERGNSSSWSNTWGWSPGWTYPVDEFRFDKLSQPLAVSYQYGTNYQLNGYYNTYIGFSEPMDTTKMSIAYTEGTKPERFSMKTAWNNDRTRLYLVPLVTAGDVDNRDASFVVLIKGLQDMAGNTYEIKYTKTDGSAYTTPNLGFKFTQLKDYLLP